MSKIWRVVFDTNVLVAALKSKNGASFQLLSMLELNKFEIALSIPLYMEYLDVLMRSDVKPLNVSDDEVLEFIRKTLDYSHKQTVYFSWRPFLRDANDDMVLELAVASQADYIVTFNLKDFDKVVLFGIEAISPKQFLKIIRETYECN